MILLAAFLVVFLAGWVLGRRYEEARCAADLARLGRHIDKQLQAHRDQVDTIR